MKKILIILFAILLFSCGTPKENTGLPKEFDADILISASGTEYTALYEKRDGFDRLTFSSPEHLNGLVLTLKDGVTTVKMDDLEFLSEEFSAAFDFLPVKKSEVRNIQNRRYEIKIKERH